MDLNVTIANILLEQNNPIVNNILMLRFLLSANWKCFTTFIDLKRFYEVRYFRLNVLHEC